MADPHANMTQSTPQEIIISVIAGLLAPLLAIFLVVQLIRGIQEKQVDVDTSEAANKTVVARIKPFATLVALDANAPRVEQSGEQVFNTVCAACHTPGALGAPKLNAKGDWASRLGQGFDTLTKHAIEGIRAMPPRGGNPDLSDIEVARAVAYMANSAGASFKEPAAEAAPAAAGAPATPPGTAPKTETAATAPGAAPVAASPANAPASAPVASTPAAKPAPVSPPKSTPSATTVPAAVASSPATAKPTPVADSSGKGESIYKQSCAVCHAAGVAGAPKLTDKAAWAPRIAKGMETLYASGIKGKGAMPAKGGNPSLSEADVKAAVDYMVSRVR